ncbi:unnamed protein product [Porites evermanni]|uniref:Macro domain-containing protein n=1 Tax=Porites evermanni TaxID=104178 RepID=A0ABN8LP97_9CNID|nr:unnamed protein product [Porites evermanni]
MFSMLQVYRLVFLSMAESAPLHTGKHKLVSKFSDVTKVSAKDSKIKKLEVVGTEASYKLTERTGNLFSCPDSESLAHCISADVRMGKGIAVSFKTKFGGVDELKSQGQKPGGVAILRRGNRHIYYLVTKEKYFHKPTYPSLQSSLQAMKGHCVSHGVTSLSMPMIGCGLDGLEWPKVRNIIEEVFQDTDINITVYSLPRARWKKT